MAKKRAKSASKAKGSSPAPTELALLRAVLADPDDDAPRLNYADLLDEHGDCDRAEFIRLQIERARRPRRDPTRIYYGDRENALLEAHGAQWLAPLPEAARRHVKFERGFPGRVEPELTDFLSWDDTLWQVAPVTALWLGDRWLRDGEYREGLDKEREMRALAAKPQLAHVRTLDLTESGYFVLADLDIFFTSPHLSKLRQMTVSDVGAGPPNWGGGRDGVVHAVVRARDLSGLKWLNLESDGITHEGVAALLASRLLPQLTELVLANNDITDEGAERLASSPRLARLEYLHLYCAGIGDRGALALAASPHLRHLKELSLMGNNFGEEAQAALRESFGDRLAL
jgi:uncharacterized protein (TIGR02996 family)